jgi:hypothetical protein
VKQGGPSNKPSRAAEGDSVKQGGASTKPGRAADDSKKKKAKKPATPPATN